MTLCVPYQRISSLNDSTRVQGFKAAAPCFELAVTGSNSELNRIIDFLAYFV